MLTFCSSFYNIQRFWDFSYCVMSQYYYNFQTTVIFLFWGVRIQNIPWNRSECGVHVRWEKLSWNGSVKLHEQSCFCTLTWKANGNWNRFHTGFTSTECKRWRPWASSNLWDELGSVTLIWNTVAGEMSKTAKLSLLILALWKCGGWNDGKEQSISASDIKAILFVYASDERAAPFFCCFS